jgi:hypothetical protein
MDNDKLYMFTVYNTAGIRIYVRLFDNSEAVTNYSQEETKYGEKSYITKVWECTELKKENANGKT